MQEVDNYTIQQFFVVGINYKKTDAAIRGRFAVSTQQAQEIFAQARENGMSDLLILSTCNRTELYGRSIDENKLIALLVQKEEELFLFKNHCYIKSGEQAIKHLFHVTAGLDSQLLGDYEIVGQVKNAFRFSKEQQLVSPFLERMINTSLQSAKKIRHQTKLSGGTVSVSYAAIQYIKENIDNYQHKNILLIGIGKLGRTTSKNIVDYLESKKLTLINRNPDKAADLSSELGIQFAPIENLNEEIKSADIILVAANASQPLISCTQLSPEYGKKHIIDLSIPYCVEPCVDALTHITLVNVDELAKLKDKTLEERKQEIPKATAIIQTHFDQFLDWYDLRKQAPVLNAIKSTLRTITEHSLTASTNRIAQKEENIQKIINKVASKMKTNDQTGCYYLEAINDYMTLNLYE